MADFEFDNRTFDSDNLDVGDEETMLIDPTDDVDIGADVGIGTTGSSCCSVTAAGAPPDNDRRLLQCFG